MIDSQAWMCHICTDYHGVELGTRNSLSMKVGMLYSVAYALEFEVDFQAEW